MKKVVFVFFIGMGVLASYSLGFCQLTQASFDEVVAVANNWLHLGQEMEWAWSEAGDFVPNSLQMIEDDGEVLAYSLPIEGGGYVIVPAYTELPP
ncbi:MAG: hypothetical protein FJY66_02470, partial [Calditrichaeota bacterium]|nr:hypothetical protein [Calditrichota bacterium]